MLSRAFSQRLLLLIPLLPAIACMCMQVCEAQNNQWTEPLPQQTNAASQPPRPESQWIPEPLRPWIPWALWDEESKLSPPTYRDAQEKIHYWPSQVEIDADQTQGDWKVPVRVFRESWIPLPGGIEHWPMEVSDGTKNLIVVEHHGFPSVKLPAGSYTLQGRWRWNAIPQKIAIPRSYGWIRLMVRDELVATPNWDSNGQLWLNRATVGEVEQDSFSYEVYRLLQDGSPMWLRTEIDLTATGKSREEELGFVLPEGWQLSYVTSSIPVAIDETGKLKAQIRAGNWTIVIDAFRNTDLKELKYSVETPPAKPTELLALQPAPNLRTVELQGLVPIDAQITRFPEKWRNLTVFQWNTNAPVTLVEKTRGMGADKPNELSINRVLWLDDDGVGITYEDSLFGEPRQITRLDVANNHELGVVRIRGARQLITQNPTTGSQGFELRERRPQIEAVGRATTNGTIAATGWQTTADKLQISLYLPPGWRVLALFGADRVEGDWLTAWTLLDMFLLLVFSLAVFRLYGILPGLIALVAFALCYHEPGSPRWTWFFLLIPVALLRVVGTGKHEKALIWWRNIALAILLFNLIPFAAVQIQNAIYPQLEPNNNSFRYRTLFQWMDQTSNDPSDRSSDSGMLYMEAEQQAQTKRSYSIENYPQSQIPIPSSSKGLFVPGQSLQASNMLYDPKTSIQTGVAKPQWIGNSVQCFWDGPVSAEETIRPILISCNMHRAMTALRLILIAILLVIMLEGLGKRWKELLMKATPATGPTPAIFILALAIALGSGSFHPLIAQIPDSQTLGVLKERLKQANDSFPHAAEIPEMKLKLDQNQLELQTTIHATAEVAVPLPGKFPSWFPRRVLVDGQDAVVTRRDDGHLWVLVPQGIHSIEVDGRVVEATEWTWAFILPPRQLQIDAADWTWTGVSNDGKPENQVIFVRKEQRVEGEANYDQKNFRAAFRVERRLEIGLVWKVFTTVSRRSQLGKAVSVPVPIVDGEQIVTPGIVNKNGSVDVNFGAEDRSFEWQSEIPISEQIKLSAKPTSNVSEKWLVETSPVWSMQAEGGTPIFDTQKETLIPEWYPWPGDAITLQFKRPAAVPGKLLTIQSLVQSLELGSRQRKSKLTFDVESSLGGEQTLLLPPNSTVTDIRVGGRNAPIRRQGDQCLLTLQPGAQNVIIEWTSEELMSNLVVLPKLEMPSDVANIRSEMQIPGSQWVLWAQGPVRGPAVRFWVILVVSICIAIILGSRFHSPLRTWEWILLVIGLTQVNVVASLLVVVWLFSISMRKRMEPMSLKADTFNFLQIVNVILTVVAIGTLVSVVGVGLLGSPRMFIVGNESYEGYLKWFTPRSGEQLPQPWVFAVSIWYYRILMLLWALWLANSLLTWLKEWWRALTSGSGWRTQEKIVTVPKVSQVTAE